ncbi:hypothetical protein SLOPH_994 [Spraguea lophii 42_110]|uniref:Uncharacterized protein n=1 Tax=Spraguea lophii (strain 42_110) TaxID=1358809 RepID=S7WAR8_SPRLO|nr:hypothetical protein SLOPH_994 [Spraguea lophii 42_110]
MCLFIYLLVLKSFSNNLIYNIYNLGFKDFYIFSDNPLLPLKLLYIFLNSISHEFFISCNCYIKKVSLFVLSILTITHICLLSLPTLYILFEILTCLFQLICFYRLYFYYIRLKNRYYCFYTIK